jgi:hypothetical protein
MAQKISDYTGITGGIFDDDDLFDISEHIGSGLYQTRSITGAEIKASISGGSPLADADQTIATTGTRKITLGGSTGSDLLIIEAASGTDLIHFRGDDSIYIPSGEVGMGGYFPNTSRKFNIYQNQANGFGFYLEQRGTGHRGYHHLNGANVTGTSFQSINKTAGGTGIRTGIELDVANGSLNYAINVLAGDVLLGGAATDKVQFYGGTAVVQAAAYTATDATATDGTIATNDTITNNLRVIVDEIKATLDSATGVGLNA